MAIPINGPVQDPFTSSERKGDIRFRYAYEMIDSVLLSIPDGWQIEGIPTDTTYGNKVGSCNVSYQTDGAMVRAQYQFVLNAPNWEVADYSSVRKLFVARQAMSEATLVLKPAN